MAPTASNLTRATIRGAAAAAGSRADRTTFHRLTMKILPPPLRFLAWRPLCALGAVLLLSACANSDFGELNQTLVTDGIHDWLGRDSPKSHPVPASTFEYTDDE